MDIKEIISKLSLEEEKQKLAMYKAQNLNLDMSRGKPSKAQLDIGMPFFDVLTSASNLVQKADYRNYGLPMGVPELKDIFTSLLGVDDDELMIGGNSSLNLMYDSLQRAMQFGVLGGEPFNKQGKLKWLCPVPGYDRHFAITETFGFEMINIPMFEDGPDMRMIKELVENDESIKGIWCVPKYSNPQGIVYSDRVVTEFAKLKPKAKDFRIYWDNAYMVHGLCDDNDVLLNILNEAKKYNNQNIVYMFGSTSKITFAGSGVSFISASKENIEEIKKRVNIQTIGPDKINQYAHALYLKSPENINLIMSKHKEILAPKFKAVLDIFDKELKGIAKWNSPKGGYFISVDLPNGTAKRVVELAKSVGVAFTPAGSTYPYKKDPNDSNLRIAPSLPPVEELIKATEVFVVCVKLAVLENK